MGTLEKAPALAGAVSLDPHNAASTWWPTSLLAAAIADRGAFATIAASGEPEFWDGPDKAIWAQVSAFYARDTGAARADAALVRSAALARARGAGDRELLEERLREIDDTPASPANVVELLMGQRRRRIGQELSVALALDAGDEEVRRLIEEYQRVGSEAAPVASAGHDWEALVQQRTNDPAPIKLGLKSLMARLGGGLRPGHNLTIFGRPESGKTALAVSLACGAARSGHRVLYFGNEDPISDISYRALLNLSRMLPSEASENPAEALKRVRERGGGNLSFVELAPGTLAEIEAHVMRLRPEVVVIDQMRNLKAAGKAKDTNYTLHLDVVAQAIRALAKRHRCVTIAVTQAGDSARNRPVLDSGDVDFSNTGIPAAADVLLGVGTNPQLESAGRRMLTLVKNKLTGIHDHWAVRLDPLRSRVTSLDGGEGA